MVRFDWFSKIRKKTILSYSSEGSIISSVRKLVPGLKAFHKHAHL